MARGRRLWGQICPDDGGLLLEHADWGERLYCPNNGHGGNGRFFDAAEVKEGWVTMSTGDGSGLTESQIRRMRADSQADPASDAAAEANVVKAVRAKRTKDPRDCECGCGAQTKGGRFIPGHDAKLHKRLREEAAAAAQ